MPFPFCPSFFRFQSTFPRGERRLVKVCIKKIYLYRKPRTHAGTDNRLSFYLPLIKNFNPSSHEGNDDGERRFKRYIENFNPRSHEGNDSGALWSRYTSFTDFNPRSHEGNDKEMQTIAAGILYFNPRSHEGNDQPHNDFFST